MGWGGVGGSSGGTCAKPELGDRHSMLLSRLLLGAAAVLAACVPELRADDEPLPIEVATATATATARPTNCGHVTITTLADLEPAVGCTSALSLRIWWSEPEELRCELPLLESVDGLLEV